MDGFACSPGGQDGLAERAERKATVEAEVAAGITAEFAGVLDQGPIARPLGHHAGELRLLSLPNTQTGGSADRRRGEDAAILQPTHPVHRRDPKFRR